MHPAARVCLLLLVSLGLAAPAVAQDFTASVDNQTVYFSSESPSGELVVVASIIEDLDNDNYPNEAEGFSFGLECDPDYLLPLSAISAGDLVDLNDGEGPGFESIEIANDDEGFVVGIIFGSLFDIVPLALDGEVIEMTFGLVEDNLIDAVDVVLTDLAFTDDLHVPPAEPGDPDPPTVDAIVVVDAESILLLYDNAVITLDPTTVFKRGDTNGDETVFAIIDALFLLQYGFVGGTEPPCFDAADADDNGDVFPIIDALFLLQFGFTNGPEPADPGPNVCGADPTDDDTECETGCD